MQLVGQLYPLMNLVHRMVFRVSLYTVHLLFVADGETCTHSIDFVLLVLSYVAHLHFFFYVNEIRLTQVQPLLGGPTIRM